MIKNKLLLLWRCRYSLPLENYSYACKICLIHCMICKVIFFSFKYIIICHYTLGCRFKNTFPISKVMKKSSVIFFRVIEGVRNINCNRSLSMSHIYFKEIQTGFDYINSFIKMISSSYINYLIQFQIQKVRLEGHPRSINHYFIHIQPNILCISLETNHSAVLLPACVYDSCQYKGV